MDVSGLDLGFGGFTPVALGDGATSRKLMIEAQRRARARQESRERAAAIEAARASDIREWDDGSGTVWKYVVLDGEEVRVERCETQGVELAIPADIEGRPVVALAADACAYLPTVERITCPDSLLSIGFCAFRGNGRLKKVNLSGSLARFDSDWFRGCPGVEYLALPGQVALLDSSIFDMKGLRTLVIGAGTEGVVPGAFAKSGLETVRIDEGNPFLMTDGRAVYGRDGSVLIALAVPVVEYRVFDGCKAIARKGFSGFACVRRVEVPDGLEVLDGFSLSRTGITSFTAPASLGRIGEKAFFNCAELEHVHLNEGLVSVSDNAFSGTNVHELRLPSSIEELGYPVATGTDLTYSGMEATFSLAEGSERLELDGQGGLYRREGVGKRLIRMMDPTLDRYEVQSGTTAIGAAAFADHARMVEVLVPEGVVDIGQAAFKGCRNLVHVGIPDSVESIGEEAFLDTGIVGLRLPARLGYLGTNALVTYGAHHGDVEPSLQGIAVEEANERFYTTASLLLERKDGGGSAVVLCTGSVETVCIPEEVDEIAPYAFNGVGGIRELCLSDRITHVGIRGLAVDSPIEHIHIDLAEPVSGKEFLDIRFPHTDRSIQQMKLALSVPDHVDVAAILASYDNAVINGSSFDPKNDEGLSVYDQAVRIVERLGDPVFLTPVNHSMCDRILKSKIERICVEAARHDDRKLIDALLDLEYLNGGNINATIDRVGALQDAAMTGYLLEAKRLRFKSDTMDFDL